MDETKGVEPGCAVYRSGYLPSFGRVIALTAWGPVPPAPEFFYEYYLLASKAEKMLAHDRVFIAAHGRAPWELLTGQMASDQARLHAEARLLAKLEEETGQEQTVDLVDAGLEDLVALWLRGACRNELNEVRHVTNVSQLQDFIGEAKRLFVDGDPM